MFEWLYFNELVLIKRSSTADIKNCEKVKLKLQTLKDFTIDT